MSSSASHGLDSRVVFQNETMIKNNTVWAPGTKLMALSFAVNVRAEIHKLDGKWYMYYTHGSEPHVVQGGASVSLQKLLFVHLISSSHSTPIQTLSISTANTGTYHSIPESLDILRPAQS